ncbi:MAG: MFS transporter [Burkholderiaceae bacterium]
MHSAAFRRVFAADVISTFGSLMSRLAIPWLAVLVLDAGPAAMALLAVADVAAGALAALLLGVVIDRRPKRASMIACDLLRAAALLAIPLLAWSGHLSIGALIAVVGFNGALTVAFELAQSAWIARHTESDALAGRNSALAAGSAVTEAASFGLTGWIFQLAGAAIAIVADALTYVASALLLVRVDETPPPPREQTAGITLRGALKSFAAEVRDGLQTVVVHPTLRALASIAALTAFGSGFAATTYMIYVARDLGFSTGALGMIFALGGLGSLAGAWGVANLARRVPPHRLLIAGLFVWAIGSAAAPLAASATVLGALLLCAQQLIGDAGGITVHIADRTLRQSHTPQTHLARVDASIRTVTHVFTLAGALLSGALAEAFGARPLLFASSTLIAIAGAVALFTLRAAGENRGTAQPHDPERRAT